MIDSVQKLVKWKMVGGELLILSPTLLSDDDDGDGDGDDGDDDGNGDGDGDGDGDSDGDGGGPQMSTYIYSKK